jgi:hypothetical protein
MSRLDPALRVRFPESLKENLRQSAAESRRSMNAEIVARLERSFREQGQAASAPGTPINADHEKRLSRLEQRMTDNLLDNTLEKAVMRITALEKLVNQLTYKHRS